jgi:O-antigen/teichoic acid export membrane protein
VALQLVAPISLIIVGALLEASDAGLYSLSLTLMGTVLLAAQTLSVSAVHRQYADEGQVAAEYTLAFARQSLLVTCAAALVMAAVAYPFIVLLYGEAFEGSVLPFVILLLVAVAVSIENPCRVVLVRLASPRLVSGIVCAAIIGNIALTVALTEALSIVGAALASVITYWVLALAMLSLVTRKTDASLWNLFRRPTTEDEVVRLARSVFEGGQRSVS